MFYVYEFYNVDTGEIVYVGKGCNNRYRVRYRRNEPLSDLMHSENIESRIVAYFDNEDDAFRYEQERIDELKEIGQSSCNIYRGGFGGLASYWGDEERQFMSDHNPMRDPIQRERMSVYNPMKNPEVASRVAKSKSRAVIIGDHEFESVKEAATFYGVYTDSIILWCKKGINHLRELCRYKDSEQVQFEGNRFNKGGCKSVTYLGKHYESGIDLADDLGISKYMVYHWLKKGHDRDGNPCTYDE